MTDILAKIKETKRIESWYMTFIIEYQIIFALIDRLWYHGANALNELYTSIKIPFTSLRNVITEISFI